MTRCLTLCRKRRRPWRGAIRVAAIVLGVTLGFGPAMNGKGSLIGEARADALDRIAETGVLRVGTRISARPFAFRNQDGDFAGFSVDLLHAIGQSLSEQLRRPLDLRFSAVTTSTRLAMIRDRQIDVVCGLTTPTWAREKIVDFTLPFFIDGTRILTHRQLGQRGLAGIQNRRIGVLNDSTTEKIVALTLPGADIVGFASMQDAMRALEAREVAAIANIGILLENLRVRSRQSVSMMLIPRSGVLHREVMSCVVPQDESRLRDAVNRALSEAFEGLDDLSGDYADIYFRWFGVDGTVYYPLNQQHRQALLASRIWLK